MVVYTRDSPRKTEELTSSLASAAQDPVFAGKPVKERGRTHICVSVLGVTTSQEEKSAHLQFFLIHFS